MRAGELEGRSNPAWDREGRKGKGAVSRGRGLAPGRNEKVMAGYVKDTYSLLKEKAGKPLAAKIGRDAEFPRGPAGRSVVLTHMRASGYSDEQCEQAGNILSAAGIV